MFYNNRIRRSGHTIQFSDHSSISTFVLLTILCFSLFSASLHAAPSTILLDNFESAFPSGLWQEIADETGGSDCRWARTVSSSASGHASISPIGAGCNPSREDIFGPFPPNANVWLKYGPFDLSSHSSAEVNLRLNAVMNGDDRIWIGHNLSNTCVGDTPFDGQNFFNGSGGVWTELSADISSRAGQSNVCIYIVLTTDNTFNGGNEFAFIDDVNIQADGRELINGTELELHAIDLEGREYYASDEVPISYSVTNHGNTASADWDISFWTAGRIEFYPYTSDQHMGTRDGEMIAAGETRRFTSVVESPNSLGAGGTWSVRGFLNFQDSNAQNNVAVDAISFKPMGVIGDVLSTQSAETSFPSGYWATAPDLGSGDSACQWGITGVDGNASESSLSPFAEHCTHPVDLLTGPLPNDAWVPLIMGPFDTSDAFQLRLTMRYFARMSSENGLLVWTKTATAQGCEYDLGYKYVQKIEAFEKGWSNHSYTLPAKTNMCILMASDTAENANTTGNNWLFVDDLQVISDRQKLKISSNEQLKGRYKPGDSVVLKLSIENVSNETISDFDLTFGIGKHFYANPDFILQQTSGHSLSAGQSQQFEQVVQIPANTAPSTYAFWVFFDHEKNRDNRKFKLNGSIGVDGPPDIDVSPLSLQMLLKPNASVSSNHTELAESNDMIAQDSQLPAMQMLRQKNLSDLRDKIQSNGQVRVIIELTDSGYSASQYSKSGTRQSSQKVIRNKGNDLLQTMKNAGLKVSTHYQYKNIPYLALSIDKSALDFIAQSPDIGQISEDRLNSPHMESSNVVIYSAQMWADGYTGNGQTVAVLDTGIDKSHSWFNNGTAKVVAEACFSSADSYKDSLCPDGISPAIGPGTASTCELGPAACTHGTHVAGTAAGNDGVGRGYGVAKNADIISVQVFHYDPSFNKYFASDSDLIAALEHVLELSETIQIAAVNMSLGSGQYFNQETCDLAKPAIKAAIDNLRAANVATVVSAGNDGYTDSIGSPACISSAISVGATTDDDEVATFSNIYPQLHLLAPGVDITSSVPGEQLSSLNGTSMAAPHVAGALAALRQLNPSATVSELLALLQSTGDPVDDLRPGGTENNLLRINLSQVPDGATDFSYARFNIANVSNYSTLNISAIDIDPPTPWIAIDPALPFTLLDEQNQPLNIRINRAGVPEGVTTVRLVIYSDDLDENPYPGGVYLQINRQGETILINSFEDP